MSPPAWAEQLVAQLTKFANPKHPNRAVLAHLRRGLDIPLDYALGRVGWLFARVPDRDLTAAVLAAGLFARTKGDCAQTPGVSFGAAFGAGLSTDEKQRRERRFVDLLDTDFDELPYKLRQVLTLIARENVGLDWGMLIVHIRSWSHEDRWVQKWWARDFWAAPVEEEVSADAASATE